MPAPQHTDASVFTGPRLPAIDAMRGLVMVLMAMDHASHVFNTVDMPEIHSAGTRQALKFRPPSSSPAG